MWCLRRSPKMPHHERKPHECPSSLQQQQPENCGEAAWPQELSRPWTERKRSRIYGGYSCSRGRTSISTKGISIHHNQHRAKWWHYVQPWEDTPCMKSKNIGDSKTQQSIRNNFSARQGPFFSRRGRRRVAVHRYRATNVTAAGFPAQPRTASDWRGEIFLGISPRRGRHRERLGSLRTRDGCGNMDPKIGHRQSALLAKSTKVCEANAIP